MLGNDIDYDRGYAPHGTIQVDLGSVDTAGMAGQLDIRADGRYWWTSPYDYWDVVTSFRYRITDGIVTSGYATCTIIMPDVDLVEPPPVDASNDSYPVGENPITAGSVLENDPKGDIAVLVSHPAAGRLTSFGTDGWFSYTPQVAGGDQTFGYATFNLTGGAQPSAEVLLFALNMRIENGQSGPEVKPEESKTVGAFTVANLNDTDGDGTVDNKDQVVKRSPPQTTGVNEMDLMRLTIHQPADPNPAPVTLTVQGNAKLWRLSTKETEFALTNGSASIAPSDFVNGKFTLWVEITEASAAQRDVTISMGYKGQTESVKATGVWVTFSAFLNTGATSPVGMGGKGKRLFDTRMTEGYVLGHTSTTPSCHNLMIIGMVVSPPGMFERKNVVVFDMSRIKEARVWDTNAQGVRAVDQFVQFPAFRDFANVDRNDQDEDNTPDNDHIYSYDGPGMDARGNYQFLLRKEANLNFFEFARVLIVRPGRTKFPDNNNGDHGSRASDFVPWRSRLDAIRAVTTDPFARNPAGINDIIQGPHTRLP